MQKLKSAIKATLPFLFAAVMLALVAVPSLAADEPEFRIITAEQTSAAELFPVEIEEYKVEGEWRITKIYELNEGESPNGISREPFERNGWSFTCVDITERKSENTDTKEITQVAEAECDTKDIAKIIEIGLFAPTMEYASEGYTGTLKLDPTSIKAEVAETKSSSYTASATRTYPGLPRNDTSVVPKTTEEKGRTLSLASVDWKSDMVGTDEYGEPLLSWTATASYSARVATTVATGYAVTANYAGTVSRTLVGDTIYKVYFEGSQFGMDGLTAGSSSEKSITGTTTGVKPSGSSQSGDDSASGGNTIYILLFLLIFIMAGAIGYLFYKQYRQSRSS